MSVIRSFVAEIEAAVASGDPEKRVTSLRRVTDLFMDQAPALGEDHVAVFDEVILRLARDLEFKARIELSERLADVENAPRQAVRNLALDVSAAVAAPVLERSNRLGEDDLVAVARERGPEHLMAITRRASLSERVTDVLVDRGDAGVVRAVAGNENARFSSRGLGRLVDRAREDAALQGTLRKRADIPGAQMAVLLEIARAKVSEALGGEFGADAADSAIERAAAAFMEAGPGRALLGDFAAATAAVERQARAKGLSEDAIAFWIKAGKTDEVLAALAHLAHLPVETVARAYGAAQYDPLLCIVRSVRFSWNTFKLLLAHKAGRQPPAEVVRTAFEHFQALSVPTAQRVVRFTLARERTQPTAA